MCFLSGNLGSKADTVTWAVNFVNISALLNKECRFFLARYFSARSFSYFSYFSFICRWFDDEKPCFSQNFIRLVINIFDNKLINTWRGVYNKFFKGPARVIFVLKLFPCTMYILPFFVHTHVKKDKFAQKRSYFKRI